MVQGLDDRKARLLEPAGSHPVSHQAGFDTTSTYFEGRGPRGLAELGYSRDKRPDLVQVVIGLVMTRDGIPVAHHVLPGDTSGKVYGPDRMQATSIIDLVSQRGREFLRKARGG